MMPSSLSLIFSDGSHAIQFGKMPMLRLDDYTAQNSSDWYRSCHTTPYDIHLCGYVQIIIIMAQWRKESKQVCTVSDFITFEAQICPRDILKALTLLCSMIIGLRKKLTDGLNDMLESLITTVGSHSQKLVPGDYIMDSLP